MDEEYVRMSREDRKADKLEMGAAVGIRNGAQCVNRATDQQYVMALLNKIPTASGGTLSPTGPTLFKAPRDGYCDPTFAGQIRRFQEMNGLPADGAVDPNGPTLRALNTLSTGGTLSARTAKALSPDQLAKVHELLDLSYALLHHREFDRIWPGFRPRLESAVKEVEAGLTNGGMPVGMRRPPQTTNAIQLVGVSIGLAELIAICAVGVMVQIAIVHTLLPLYKQMWLPLLRTASDVLIALSAEVARLGVNAMELSRCGNSPFMRFRNVTNRLIDALAAGHSSTAVLRPVMHAWSNAFQDLIQCLTVGAAGRVRR